MLVVPKGPKKIVCLTEEPTEILYLLGESERIVGISAYTVRPPEAKKNKPVVSAFLNGSVRKICELKPDLIIGFSDIQAELAKKLILANQPVLIFNQRSIQEILQVISTIGNLVGAHQKAQHLVSGFVSHIEKVQKRNSLFDFRPRVYFEEWDNPMICSIEWVSELIHIAGGENIFSEKSEGKLANERYVSVDEVAEKNPHLFLASWCGKPWNQESTLMRFEKYKVHAFASGQMYEIPSEVILQPGPACLTDGLSHLETHIQQARRFYAHEK